MGNVRKTFDADTGEGEWLVLDVAGHVICDSRPKGSANVG